MAVRFTRARLAGVSSMALGCALVMGATPAWAQDVPVTTTEETQASPVTGADTTTDQARDDAATPAPATTDEAPADQEIVVTGFRAALQSATNTKKRQEQIVESVTAEDIGKLPDASIGESIARLPGIASQRTQGRANVISIRGFGPDFSQTLLNGREQTSTNDNRGVEFDQYPSEIINQVVVYKSPAASLVGQGLVGTVDLRTIRPIDFGKRVLAVGARGSYTDLGKLNAGSKDKGYRVNATFVDQFADDRLGIAVSAAYLDEPYQNEEYNAWGFFTPDATGNLFPSGFKSFVTSTQLKRFGLNGTVQARPTDAITLTADGFYSHFDDDQTKRGIELPVSFFGTTGVGDRVEDGQYVSGTLTNVQGVVRNDIFNRKADLYSVGFNAAFDNDGPWKGFLDFGWSRTDREELSIESYSGTGYNWDQPPAGSGIPQAGFPQSDPTDTLDFECDRTGCSFDPTLDYSDTGLIRLTDPLGWGGSRVQAGYYNNRIVKDDLKQYRAELERELQETGFLGGIKAGINFTDRTKSLTPDEFFVGLAGGATELDIPEQYLLRPTNLRYLGLGPIVSYDPRDLLDDGVLVLDPNTSNDIPAKAYEVKEKLLTGYIQANIDAELGTAQLTGNLGLQVVRTDQSSSGIAFLNGTQVDVSSGAKYTDWLPQMNLSARFPNDWVVRFAASKQMQRPRLDDLRSAISYGASVGPNGDFIYQGSGGNPTLQPYRARAVDFNIEKYFGGSGYIALQLFHKKLKDFILTAQEEFDFSAYPPPASGPVPTTTIGLLTAPTNVGDGKLYGWELAGTLPFRLLTQRLDGFGFTGGLGYTKSKVRDPNGVEQAIPGYSKWVANGTLFFEKWGFNTRGSVRHRTGFLGDFVAFGGSTQRRNALKETIVDGQVGYDFSENSPLKGLSLYLQGQNLTDERFGSLADPERPLTVIDYQVYGRRFLAGLTYKF